jgi:phosphorylcholine metabolism protein LicD
MSKFIAKIKLILLIALQGAIKNKPDLKRFRPLMKFCAYFTWLIGKCFSSKRKYSYYEKVSRWGNKTPTKMVSCYNTIFGYMGQLFSSAMMSGYSLHPFEDTELFIMNGFDEFLANTYGDYMTPPKERVGHHLHPEYSHSYK